MPERRTQAGDPFVSLRRDPANEYDAVAAERAVSVARSYLEHAGELIYSYGSRTFLSGYGLFDPDRGGRGNIDCSTLVMLVLAGIPYEESPYAGKSIRSLSPRPLAELDLSAVTDIPERYIGIAERIGRPYLAGPKGLDMDRAAQLGISAETLREEIRRSGVRRRSEALAADLLRRGECFADSSFLRPGDLAFYVSSAFFGDAKGHASEEAPVTHVGIVCSDRGEMIHSSGYHDRDRAAAEGLGAVSVSPVFSRRVPAFFARPLYIRPGKP